MLRQIGTNPWWAKGNQWGVGSGLGGFHGFTDAFATTIRLLEINMMKFAILAALLAGAAMPAQAAVLVLNSGWQYDEVGAANSASNNSPWTFTLTQSADFLVTDAFNQGDVYRILNSVDASLVGTTAFSTDGDLSVTDFFGTSWLDTAYSRVRITLGAGSYSFDIYGNCAGGCPAGFGVQLVGGVIPEPATWGMMIAGFGLVGGAMRRRAAATA